MGDICLTKAMSVALFERSYDRQFVIDLENSLVSFMESEHVSYQLAPMNSYYRLLAHQLAEYHGLKHALAKNYDTCVVVFKGESFSRSLDIPLLQHLDLGNELYRHRIREVEGSRKLGSGPVQTTHSNANNVRVLATQKRANHTASAKIDGPTTPQKSRIAAIDEEDDSPQPRQFETSRYSFEQQAETHRQKRRSHKKSHSLTTPPIYSQPMAAPPPLFNIPIPYMMYNPYAMMYIPPEHQFPPYYQGPNALHMSPYANYNSAVEPPRILESSRSDNSVFSGRKSESTTDNSGQAEKTR
ncbi:LAFA_0G22474g1_1 [Lachancea sp. 'fantastica']|nr:LAFA_0G22474g1_1 [Lachancea sp. 'fantastica']